MLSSCRDVKKSLIFSSDNKEPTEPWIPPFEEKIGESIESKRSRLTYQSRKRGMLENGLLLSSFASKHLGQMNPEQVTML